VPFELLRAKEPLEHPGRESRVTAAALTRYRHPLTLALGVQGYTSVFAGFFSYMIRRQLPTLSEVELFSGVRRPSHD
jgi:hypothetical protein